DPRAAPRRPRRRTPVRARSAAVRRLEAARAARDPRTPRALVAGRPGSGALTRQRTPRDPIDGAARTRDDPLLRTQGVPAMRSLLPLPLFLLGTLAPAQVDDIGLYLSGPPMLPVLYGQECGPVGWTPF